MSHFLVYVRRSYRPNGAPDISDEAQVEAAVAMLPKGATHEVIADSGGHHSGRTANRDGYRELVRRIEAGGITGLAVYDLSRLARHPKIMHDLQAVLDRQRVALLVGNMPGSKFDSAVGRFMFAQLVAAAAFQADMDSERAIQRDRLLFEDGRHRGNPPRGYRNGKDSTNRRTLEIDEPQAARVRQMVAMMADRSYSEIAQAMTADGYPMTTAAVKDVARRLRVYLGFVVARRGLDERPGKHPPLITDHEYRAAIAGIRQRTHAGRRPKAHRIYLLSGVLHCVCGSRMRGEARVSRGQEWRYYLCRSCSASSVPAEAAEAAVLRRLARLPLLTRSTLDRAEQAAQARITSPVATLTGKQRERLERSIANLRKQHEWGDITDAEYRRGLAEKQAELARLPDPDRVVAFRDTRRVVESMAELIADGGPLARQRLIRLAVERAIAVDRRVAKVLYAPVIRDALWLRRPRTDPSHLQTPDKRPGVTP